MEKKLEILDAKNPAVIPDLPQAEPAGPRPLDTLGDQGT